MRKRITAVCAAALFSAALTTPAAAQDWSDADAAAEEMMTGMYVYDAADYKLPSQIVANLMERGYTDIDDFDVEWGEYEVEATSPTGDDVELEIDPISGAIMDVDDDWF